MFSNLEAISPKFYMQAAFFQFSSDKKPTNYKYRKPEQKSCTPQKMFVKSTQGVNFTNILRVCFSYGSKFRSFKDQFCDSLAKGYWQKTPKRQMLVKLTPGEIASNIFWCNISPIWKNDLLCIQKSQNGNYFQETFVNCVFKGQKD